MAIHDAGDGGAGRRLYRLAHPGLPGGIGYVIAATPATAREWAENQAGPLPELVVEDNGSADRTEIVLWRDETRA